MTKTRARDVLITGVSTGIGHDSARAFLARGYRVFGTVRTAADAGRLKGELPAGFEPLIVDVTDGAAVERELGALASRLDGGCLGALINNAGIALPGPLAEQSFEQIRRMFDVNLFGVLAVTRACLPMLGTRSPHPRAPGTIVNISSGAGKLSFPFLGAYVASKHALEGLSNSLRRELMPWDVKVVVVGPGNVKTPIWDKAGDESLYDHTSYGPTYRNFVRYMFAGARRVCPPTRSPACWCGSSRPTRPRPGTRRSRSGSPTGRCRGCSPTSRWIGWCSRPWA